MINIYNNSVSTSGLLTGTGAETVYDTTVAITYSIDGRAYVKAAVTDGVTPVLDGNTGAAFVAVTPLKSCVFAWCLDAAGTVSLIQGPLVDLDADGTTLKQPAPFPNIPAERAMFAYTLFSVSSTGAAAGLRPGTNNWNSTGLTASHRNTLSQPSRPVAA